MSQESKETLITVVDGKPLYARDTLAQQVATETNSIIIGDYEPNLDRTLKLALFYHKNLVLTCSQEMVDQIINKFEEKSIPFTKDKYIASMIDQEIDLLHNSYHQESTEKPHMKEDVNSDEEYLIEHQKQCYRVFNLLTEQHIDKIISIQDPEERYKKFREFICTSLLQRQSIKPGDFFMMPNHFMSCMLVSVAVGKPKLAKDTLALALTKETNSILITDNEPNLDRTIELACFYNKNIVLSCSPEMENKVMNKIKEKQIPTIQKKHIAVMNDNELEFLSTSLNYNTNKTSKMNNEVHSLIESLCILAEQEAFDAACVCISKERCPIYEIVARSIHNGL